MRTPSEEKRRKIRLRTAVVMFVLWIPGSALVTFLILYLAGTFGNDPNRSYAQQMRRIKLRWEMLEKVDWPSAIMIFVAVLVASQILSNLDLIRDPPLDLFGSKRDDRSLSITLDDDGSIKDSNIRND